MSEFLLFENRPILSALIADVLQSQRGEKNGKTYDVIVVGAGTSGMMAAITAAKQGARVLLIENKKSARNY